MLLQRTPISRLLSLSPFPRIQPLVLILARARFSVTSRAMAQEYKLKGVSSLDLKEGQMQELEVEGVEDRKVLLLKNQGQVHATSPKCTHFGAPLKNGVMSSDGRLTCPWHGGGLLPLSTACSVLIRL